MKRLLALIPAGLLALSSFLPAYAAPATSDPLLLAPTFISETSSVNVPHSTTTTTAFTYTVPNGRVFRLQAAKVITQANATGLTANINVAGQPLVIASPNTTGVPFYQTDQYEGPLDLPAGTSITGVYSNGNGTSALQEYIDVYGVEFNAP